MLWTLLVGISSVAVLSGSLGWASKVRAGSRGYAVAALIGVVLAVLNVAVLSNVASLVRQRIESCDPPVRERYLRMLYGLTLLWALLAGAVGYFVVSLSMDVLH